MPLDFQLGKPHELASASTESAHRKPITVLRRMPSASELSLVFTAIVTSQVSARELLQINWRNARQPNPKVCHSQDFCDATEAMALAFGVFGIDPLEVGETRMSDDKVELWNDAWTLSKASGFGVLELPH